LFGGWPIVSPLCAVLSLRYPDVVESMRKADWWRGAVIYQIYPRSFADSNGDGVGDLPGITARLDYVASLGVDAVWISPFFTSPMHDYGYDVADYRDVDPLFGTLADFDVLLGRAHALGMRVIVDLVFAHTSDQHPWFQASRCSRDNVFADWYVWADAKPDGTPPNNWQSVFGGPGWTWNAERGQYFMHNFLRQQPQLNVHNDAVQDALLAVAAYWLGRGVDGFRLDAINYAMHNPALTDNPARPDGTGRRTRPFDFQSHLHNQSQPEIPAFLARLRMLTDSYDAAFVVGEIGGEFEKTEIKAYTAGDQHLHSGYSFAFLSKSTLTADLVRGVLGAWSGEQGEAGRPGPFPTTTRRAPERGGNRRAAHPSPRLCHWRC
jgi:alpha-glucosidase